MQDAKAGVCKDRHADGRAVHRHFAARTRPRTSEIALRAERIGGEMSAGAGESATQRRDVRRSTPRRWREAQTWKDPTGRATRQAGVPDHRAQAAHERIDGLMFQTLQTASCSSTRTAGRPSSRRCTSSRRRCARRTPIGSSRPTRRPGASAASGLARPAGKVTAERGADAGRGAGDHHGAPPHYRAAVALGLGCGLRVGEVLGLTPSGSTWRPGRSRSTVSGSGAARLAQDVAGRTYDRAARSRDVRAAPSCAASTAPTCRCSPVPRRRCCAATGSTTRRGDRRSRRRARRAALQVPRARHFAVSNMLGQGVSPAEVAAYVGDAVETITTTYSPLPARVGVEAKSALDLALLGRRRLTATGFATSDASGAHNPWSERVVTVSRPVSGILWSPGDRWPSICAVYPRVCRLRRGRAGRPCPLLGLAPGGVYRAVRVAPHAGALLPHRFTLTCDRRSLTPAHRRSLSVALSVRSPRPGSRQHPALWSPDFPRPPSRRRRRGHPADSPSRTSVYVP